MTTPCDINRIFGKILKFETLSHLDLNYYDMARCLNLESLVREILQMKI